MMEKSTKKLIIGVLGEQYPLTLKQIHKEIKKHKNVSYQAVHKAIKELTEEKNVEKIEKQYFLDKEWVKKQTKMFSKFYSNYFRINYSPNQIDKNAKIQVFRFSSIKELIDFLVNAYIKGYFGQSKDICVSARAILPFVSHKWLQFAKKVVKEHDIYMISRRGKLADKLTAKFYRSFGIKVKTGIIIPHYDTVCIGDCAILYYFFFDQKYRDKFHSFSEKKSNLNFLKKNFDVLNKKTEIYIVINRQKLFVDDVRQSIMKEF